MRLTWTDDHFLTCSSSLTTTFLKCRFADLGYRDVQGEQHGDPSHCWVLEGNFKMIKCSWLDNLSQDLLCLLHHWLAILLGALTESWLRSRPLWCTWCKMDSIETICFSKMNHLFLITKSFKPPRHVKVDSFRIFSDSADHLGYWLYIHDIYCRLWYMFRFIDSKVFTISHKHQTTFKC
jgi:hypothetical protein